MKRVQPIYGLIVTSLLAWVVTGCAASRPISGVALGAGGAALANQLSGGDPGLTAAGAAGGVLLSEGMHYLARSESTKAYAAGYDKGRSDTVKHQYWLYVSLQKSRSAGGSVRLYPVFLPEQRIDGALFRASVKNLRIEE